MQDREDGAGCVEQVMEVLLAATLDAIESRDSGDRQRALHVAARTALPHGGALDELPTIERAHIVQLLMLSHNAERIAALELTIADVLAETHELNASLEARVQSSAALLTRLERAVGELDGGT